MTSMKIDAADVAIARQASADLRQAATVSSAEYDIIWAALRHYAASLEDGSADDVEDIATNAGEHSAPTSESVDTLADRFAEFGALVFVR